MNLIVKQHLRGLFDRVICVMCVSCLQCVMGWFDHFHKFIKWETDGNKSLFAPHTHHTYMSTLYRNNVWVYAAFFYSE